MSVKVTNTIVTFRSPIDLAAGLKEGKAVFVVEPVDSLEVQLQEWNDNPDHVQKDKLEVGMINVKLAWVGLEPRKWRIGFDSDDFIQVPDAFKAELFQYQLAEITEEEKEALEEVGKSFEVAVKKALLDSEYSSKKAAMSEHANEISFKPFKNFGGGDFDLEDYVSKVGRTVMEMFMVWFSVKGKELSFGYKFKPALKWLTSEEEAAYKAELKLKEVRICKKRKVA